MNRSPTTGHQIDRIEKCYEDLYKQLDRDISPETKTELLELEKRLDNLLTNIEINFKIRNN